MNAAFPLHRLFRGFDQALRRALPGHCAFCLSPVDGTTPWCDPCLLRLPWIVYACPVCAEPLPTSAAGRHCGACLKWPPTFRHARVALRYEGEIAALMQRFKYSGSPRAGAILLALLLRQQATLERMPEAIVGVPLHPRRARTRGFDQVAWLARRVSRELGVPLRRARRGRMTDTQVGLGRRERQANVKGAFAIEGTLPARVLLLDDIMTTGATLEALAQACRNAGAREIDVWAVARTPAS
ncbi:ComF family protein [Halomonas sp. TA6]|nr:ComF family protein [Halomonas sp. TA6]